MPDFEESDWERNKIRIRPNDTIRRTLTTWGLSEFLPYFDASDISFDLRVFRPKYKASDIPKIEDSIKYEWVLCDKHDEQLDFSQSNKLKFYDTHGYGEIKFAKAVRFKDWDRVHPNELI